jgi:hypothetical protein
MTGNQIDQSLKHKNGFDPVSNCGVRSNILFGESSDLIGETNISVGESSNLVGEASNSVGEDGISVEETGISVRESAKTEKSCCGDYPTRKMFKTEGRGCCNGNTFNSEMAWCCPDGTVQLFGFC